MPGEQFNMSTYIIRLGVDMNMRTGTKFTPLNTYVSKMYKILRKTATINNYSHFIRFFLSNDQMIIIFCYNYNTALFTVSKILLL